MAIERLSDEQIARTAAYLAEVRERYAGNAVVHVQSLFGRCCLAMLQRNPAWDALAAEVAGLAEDLVRQAPSDLDPLPLIEVDRMMKESGRTVGSLEQLLSRIAPELESQPLEIRSIGRVRHIASLLSQGGFPIATARPSKDAAALLADVASWVTASAARLSDMADHLAADRTSLDETATRLLALIALGELRNYRLDVGCKLLRERVRAIKPRAHIFGHIHGSYGKHFEDGTWFLNVALCDEGYEAVQAPLVIDV